MRGPVTFEVGYDVGDGIFSVNMIWANTGVHERKAVMETAERHAKRYGYRVAYVKKITQCEAEEKFLRGMPISMIDKEAERKYDPSFKEIKEGV